MTQDIFVDDPAFLVLLVAAMLVGGFVKGTIGIGLPLVTIPLLALKMPPTQAIAVMMLPIFATNLWQAISCGSYSATLRRFWPVVVVVLAASAAGAAVLVSIAAETARLFLGVIVIAAISVHAVAAGRLTLPPRLERPVGVAVGALAGFLGGMSNAFGPPLVVYLLSLRVKPIEFLSAVGIMFVAGGIPLYAGLILAGQFRLQELVVSLLAGVPVGLGMVLGIYVRRFVPELLFRRFVTGALVVIGLSLVLRP